MSNNKELMVEDGKMSIFASLVINLRKTKQLAGNLKEQREASIINYKLLMAPHMN